ncbi:MAG: SlyX family protein [Spirochaetaceae bacterium]|nr:SlyX family protein [Spirochaetaceae bacterium]
MIRKGGKKPKLSSAGAISRFRRVERRLESIETKLAYLEDFVSPLQDAAVEQGREVERILGEHQAMKGRLRQIAQELETLPPQKPPHY